MFEFLILVLFGCIFWGSIRLMFKAAWGMAKVLAVILFIIALPSLIACLLFASGIILFLPVILMAIAWSILNLCIDPLQ